MRVGSSLFEAKAIVPALIAVFAGTLLSRQLGAADPQKKIVKEVRSGQAIVAIAPEPRTFVVLLHGTIQSENVDGWVNDSSQASVRRVVDWICLLAEGVELISGEVTVVPEAFSFKGGADHWRTISVANKYVSMDKSRPGRVVVNFELRLDGKSTSVRRFGFQATLLVRAPAPRSHGSGRE